MENVVFNYKDVFTELEKSLMIHMKLTIDDFDAKYNDFKNNTYKAKSDNEYFDILKLIPFYSGFKASTINERLGIINKHLPNFEEISNYTEKDIAVILADKKMIRNEGKILAVVDNAKKFKDIISEYGSFYKFLDSFKPDNCFENLMLLKENIEYQFKYLGEITVFHFLTEIGLNVLKPDRVLTRIFKRLGLIKDVNQLLGTIIQGRKFAVKTGYSIRYIDKIFVDYGQIGKNGICFENNPLCNECLLTHYCNEYKK